MAKLFTPLTIRGIGFRNRITVSPMCQYSSTDGFSNDWHLVNLGSFATGGAGLIITEATAVSPEGRITAADLGIWKDEHISALERVTNFIHQHGAVAGIQLAHAGRKASTLPPWQGSHQVALMNGGWQTVSASAIPFTEEQEKPLELDKKGIAKVIDDFKQATYRAVKAGFKVVEIHAAHGYLIHQFLSPLSNHRTDNYGGSFENRTRLLMEVVDTVRAAWPEEYPLFVRISATDWTPGGWTEDDSVRLAQLLKGTGVDLIDCSTGGNVPKAHIPVGPGYQVKFAEAIKATGILSGAVGMITEPEQANQIIEQNQADLVIMAREFLRDPHFPLRAAHTLGEKIEWPVQYERAKWH